MDTYSELRDIVSDVPLIIEDLLLRAEELLAAGDVDAADELCSQAERLAGQEHG